jgi:transposase
MPMLRGLRIYFYYLPPYSPELNEIEGVFGVSKRHELHERRYTT